MREASQVGDLEAPPPATMTSTFTGTGAATIVVSCMNRASNGTLYGVLTMLVSP